MPERNTFSQSSATTVTPSLQYPIEKYTELQVQITGMGSNTCQVKLKGVADQYATAATLANDEILRLSGVYRGLQLEFSAAGTATIWVLNYNLDEIDGG